MLKNKDKVLVLGLGKSGFSASKLAKLKDYEVIVIDEADNEILYRQKVELEKFGIQVFLGFNGNKLPLCDFIITSPGVNPKSNLGKLALESGKQIISETEFAWRYNDSPIIAITGTNGKTTATEFCVHILKNLGKNAIGAGNIGYPLSEVIMSGISYDYVVLEISSFQLHYCKVFYPHVAIILNIESDHIDWHNSFDNYAIDKLKLFKNQSPQNCLIIKKDLQKNIKSYKGQVLTFSTDSRESDYFISSDIVFRNNAKICPIYELGVMGQTQHNLENSMAVIAACYFLGIKDKDIIEASRGFKLGEHRLEIILEKDGILFVNDSKSTNPLSMMAALKAFGKSKNICLIAGGLDKDMDFSPILAFKDLIKKIFIIGKSKIKLENLFSQGFNYCSYLTFEEAVYSACDYAERGDVVLLSPGFASMDMFKNYIERGNTFKSLIARRYKDERAAKKK